MSKKMKKQSTAMEDHCSIRYRDGEVKEDLFDKIDYEVSSILLELSHLVVFSSDSPFLHKWGRTKKRSTSVFLNPPEISPVIKSLPYTEVGEMGSASSSSCLTGEAKKTNPQTIKKCIEEEFSTKSQNKKIYSQPNSVLEIQSEKTGLSREQVGLPAQPIAERVDQNLRHLQPLRCFDLNIPAAEEGNNRIAAVVGFQRVATKIQAAAQARQRRLGLIRSKKLYYSSRFISPYQFK